MSHYTGVLGMKPHHVLALDLHATEPLVFVNACSSASATFSAVGLTTFGWTFLKAGAAAYIGTLAPVTTESALKFAKAFFDAYLGQRLPILQAMYQARQVFRDDPDPTWLLYSLYGDLHAEEMSNE